MGRFYPIGEFFPGCGSPKQGNYACIGREKHHNCARHILSLHKSNPQIIAKNGPTGAYEKAPRMSAQVLGGARNVKSGT
jgi:hypothetical protein